MPKNLVAIILVAVIITLLVPLTRDLFSNQRAFTYDNLIKVNLRANKN